MLARYFSNKTTNPHRILYLIYYLVWFEKNIFGNYLTLYITNILYCIFIFLYVFVIVKFSSFAAFSTITGQALAMCLVSNIYMGTGGSGPHMVFMYTSIQMKCQGGVIFEHAPRLFYSPTRRMGYAHCSLTGNKNYSAITKLTNTM